MASCQCGSIETLFNRKTAQRNLQAYRRRGPAKSTRLLIQALAAEGIAGETLLDIGGGIGAIQLELLKAGIDSATDVDASTAYLAAARSEAERLGVGERVAYRFGNFVDVAEDIAECDVVTLDKVICCYPSMTDLVGASVAKARRLYGLVYPRETWWMRLALAVGNLAFRVQRTPFRVYLHPTHAVDGLVRQAGLVRRFSGVSGGWQIFVYTRPADATRPA